MRCILDFFLYLNHNGHDFTKQELEHTILFMKNKKRTELFYRVKERNRSRCTGVLLSNRMPERQRRV